MFAKVMTIILHHRGKDIRKSLGNNCFSFILQYSKTCLKRSLKKKTKIGFQDRVSLNAGQRYCRTLRGEHSAILSTFINLTFAFKTFVLSIFEWPLKTGFAVSIYTVIEDFQLNFVGTE